MTTLIDLSRLTPAERLLWSYGVEDPSHIDLEAVAFDRGALVIYRPLNGSEARLVVHGDKAIISVNEGSLLGRRRFSLAHEIAHWMQDRKRGSFLCAKEDIGPQNAEAKSLEADANRYASQLILPDYLVVPRIERKPVTLDTAAGLSKDFKSSLTAAAIKLAKRSTAPAVIVCHSQSKREWFSTSMAFPLDLFVAKELHQDTDGLAMLYSGNGGLSRPKREPASRWLQGPDVFTMNVLSQSVRLPDNTVLSIAALVK